MKKSPTMRLGEFIGRLWDEDPDMHEHILEQRAIELLPRILGPAMAHISRYSIQDGTLSLQPRSSIARQVITMQRADLIRRINEAVGAELVRELHIL